MTLDKSSAIEALHKKLFALTQSPLYSFRTEHNYMPVIGDGNSDASIVFVGEAPGKKEAETGKPFVGAAGKMLDSLLASIQLERKDIFITNIVNDRPPDNRDPKPDEIALYSPFLISLLTIIQPKVIVTLGRFSMRFLLEKFDAKEKEESISSLHGKVILVNTPFGPVSLVPLYHPAFALYNGGMRTVLQEDVKVLEQFKKK
jgi:DNA polymerase